MSELGATTLGNSYLGDTISLITETGQAPSLSSDRIQTPGLDPTSESTLDIGQSQSPTIDAVNAFNPVILDANNVNIQYDRERKVFVSAWIPTTTFDDERDQLIAAVDTTDTADDVTIVFERDVDGDGNAELYTDPYRIDSDIGFVRADPTGEPGRYRLVFPQYNQDNVVENINIALTYDNTQRLIENIPYEFIEADADGDTDLDKWVATFGTALDRFDILFDTVYDNQFVQTARGQGLTDLGTAIGVERRDIDNPERADDLESDARLRKRIAVARTLVGQSTTAPSFGQVLSILYPDAIGNISIEVDDTEPIAIISIPRTAIRRSPLDAQTTIDILNQVTASSYTVETRIDGTFRFDGDASGEGWNEGTWSSTLSASSRTDAEIIDPYT
jgi:hypothetical protein